MNERIRDLYDQALVEVGKQKMFDSTNADVIEKFAEMIVLECVGLAKLAQLSNTSLDVIKEHFGIQKSYQTDRWD